MRPVSARQAVTRTLGIITPGLVLLCAILLISSMVGPWSVAYQERHGSNWVSIVDLGDGDYSKSNPNAGWPWSLIPLSGVVLFIIVLASFPLDPVLRREPMAVAAGWFAIIALVLLTATDVVPASLGLGDWTGHGVGGFHYPPQTTISQLSGTRDVSQLPGTKDVATRSGWGWGAGLAWWASVGGLIACLLDLSRAILEARRQRRITAITQDRSPRATPGARH